MGDFSRYQTVSEILNGAAVECGLAPSSDAFSSNDVSFIQLRYLLTTAGREMLQYSWQQLRREYSLTISFGGAAAYALPADFDRFLDQTMWDRTKSFPLAGPASPQDWQNLNGGLATVSPITPIWRLDQDQIKLYPDPPAGSGTYASIYFEYISRCWVQDASVSTTYRDYPAAGADVVMYDSTMMVKLLALRFLGAKGFDTTNIGQQYLDAFYAAIGKNTPSQVLSVAPCGRSSDQVWSGAIANGLPA